MQTIKEIRNQIQAIQGRIQAENTEAQKERDKSDQYSQSGDIQQSQAHTKAAMDHEQRGLQMQGEITKLTAAEQQLQTQITELDRQKDALTASTNDQMTRLDASISKIRGE